MALKDFPFVGLRSEPTHVAVKSVVVSIFFDFTFHLTGGNDSLAFVVKKNVVNLF